MGMVCSHKFRFSTTNRRLFYHHHWRNISAYSVNTMSIGALAPKVARALTLRHGIDCWTGNIYCCSRIHSVWVKLKDTIQNVNISFIIFKTWWCHQMKTYSALLALCAGNSPVHRGQRRGASMFSLISARINGWANNRHRTPYGVIVMTIQHVQC